MIPDGAEKLTNNHGSAPGIWLEDARGRWVAMLPGVPREMRGMLADTLLPRLRQRYETGTVVRSLTLRTTGVGESLLADRIVTANAEPRGHDGSVTLAYLPSIAGVDLRVTVRDLSAAEADAALQSAASALRAAVGDAIYGEGDDDLAAIVLQMLRERGLTVAVAESCTGGLLGARITAIPGSSDVMRGGIIAYDNSVKRSLLGVEDAVLWEKGAVSEEVARHMATAIRGVAKANVGLAITGIAGPSGGTPEKPVGTVWIAADVEGAVDAKRLNLWGDRDEVRQRSAQWTLELLRQRLRR